MSHSYVRQQFRAVVQLVLPPLGFVWFESVNMAQRTQALPRRWYTLDFLAASDARMSLGVPVLMRESGSCLVQMFTEQQITDTPATTNADVLREQLANWRDATGKLRVNECDPVNDIDGGDFAGAFFRVAVDVRYTFDRIVAASPLALSS